MQPKVFDELEDGYYDLIIALSPEAQHHAVEMTRTMACDVEFWNTLDPSIIEGSRDVRLQAYRQVRDQLMKKIRQRFQMWKTNEWTLSPGRRALEDEKVINDQNLFWRRPARAAWTCWPRSALSHPIWWIRRMWMKRP